MASTLIQQNIPLADKNWFGTGGPARYFAEPTNEIEFQEAILFAQKNTLEIFILGQGANILISDEGLNGLVIRPKVATVQHHASDEKTELLEVGSGYVLHDLIDYCLEHNLSGLEEFSGIPGTVGGSVYINLHYFEFLLQQFLVKARIINAKTGEVIEVDPSWFSFGYDQSTLMSKEYFLLTATFQLKKVTDSEVAYARGRRTEIIRHRNNRYPMKNTCGSFFRNFHEDEVSLEISGKKMIFVAYYLDKMGIKGALKVGSAQVSYQHANMLVNQGSATSEQIIDLARLIQEMTYGKFGIIPQPECQLIGFREYPLLTHEIIHSHPTWHHTNP
jgi:UDP-N-acetylmuramate dehydrogenase